MTPEHDPYDEHLRAMGRALHTAAVRRRRAAWRARPVAAAGLAAALAAVLLALLVGVPGRSPVNVLGRAEAALAPRGELVHYVVRETVLGTGRVPSTVCPQTGVTEVWQAPRLRRWRAILPAAPEGPRCTVTIDGRRNRAVRGPVQQSWDNGTSATYVARNDTMDVVRGYSPTSSQRLVPIGGGQLGAGDAVGDGQFGADDPVARIREMLAAGRLRDDGTSTVDGRRVRTLRGSTEVGGMRTTVAYVVDVATADPVRMTTRQEATDAPTTGRARRHQRFWRTFGAVTRRVDVVRYERLPLDATGRRLLEIHPPRPPKDVTDMTQTELRRWTRRQTARQNREGAARARRAHRDRATRERAGRAHGAGADRPAGG